MRNGGVATVRTVVQGEEAWVWGAVTAAITVVILAEPSSSITSVNMTGAELH